MQGEGTVDFVSFALFKVEENQVCVEVKVAAVQRESFYEAESRVRS